MRFFRHMVLALRSYSDGIVFLFRHNLWWYFVFPLILSVGIYYLGVYYEELERTVQVAAENMRQLMFVLLKKLTFKSLSYMFEELTKYIVIMLLSPFLALLSEKIEEILTGNTYPFIWKYYINDIKRGLIVNIRSIILEYSFVLLWMLLSLIITPMAEVTGAVAWIIGFYFMGYGYMDYIHERQRLTISEGLRFTRKHMGVALTIGAVYSTCFMIPYVGVVIAPVLAITAATIAMHRLTDLNNNRYAEKKNIIT